MKYLKLKTMWSKRELCYSCNFNIITERKATKWWNSCKSKYIEKLLTRGQTVRDKYCSSFRRHVAKKCDQDVGSERADNEFSSPTGQIKVGRERRLFELHPLRKYCKQATSHQDFWSEIHQLLPESTEVEEDIRRKAPEAAYTGRYWSDMGQGEQGGSPVCGAVFVIFLHQYLIFSSITDTERSLLL